MDLIIKLHKTNIMKQLATILSFILVFSAAFAQNNSYTILAKSGTILYQNQPVKIGQVISDKEPIMLKDGAYVGLISPEGKPIEIKSAGTFGKKELDGLLQESTGTFSDKFVSFMAQEMKDDSEGYKAGMNVTGSVERALTNNKIFIPLPKKSKFIGTDLHLQWIKKEGISIENGYKVDIMNMSENVLFTKNVSATELDIKPYEIKTLIPDDLYLVRVTDNSGNIESNVVCFYLPNREENKEICRELGPLLEAKSTVLESIAAAQMLSEKGFHLSALTKYNEAIANDKSATARDTYNSYVDSLKN